MNIKQEAIEAVVHYLNSRKYDIAVALRHNTRQINKLADEQRFLKLQRMEITKTINLLRNKEKTK